MADDKRCEQCGSTYEAALESCPACAVAKPAADLELDWGNRHKPEPAVVDDVPELPAPPRVVVPRTTDSFATLVRTADIVMLVGAVFEIGAAVLSLAGAGLRGLHLPTTDTYLPSASRGGVLFAATFFCVWWTAALLRLLRPTASLGTHVASVLVMWLTPLLPASHRQWSALTASLQPPPRGVLLVPLGLTSVWTGWVAWSVVVRLTGMAVEPDGLLFEFGLALVAALSLLRMRSLVRRFHAESDCEELPGPFEPVLDRRDLAFAVAGFALLVALTGGFLAGRTSTSPPVAVRARPTPTPDAGVGRASAPIVAQWNGGVVTVAAVQAELDRLPPILLGGSPEFRSDLVYSLAVQQRLEQLARARGVKGADRFTLLRNLITVPSRGAPGTPDLEATRAQFEQLVGQIPRPQIVDAAALAAIRPSARAGVYQPGPGSARELAVWLGPVVTLTGGQAGDGTFELSWRDAPAEADTPATLPPLDWVYIELIEPGLTRGNYVVHTFPRKTLAAKAATWKVLPPPEPGPAALAARYGVKRTSAQLEGLEEADLDVAWNRVSPAVGRCLQLAAWDSRIEHANVTFSLSVVAGVMTASAPAFDDVRTGSMESKRPFVHLDRGDWCQYALTRWRFPRQVSGKATLRLSLDGRPWSDEEQRQAFGG